MTFKTLALWYNFVDNGQKRLQARQKNLVADDTQCFNSYDSYAHVLMTFLSLLLTQCYGESIGILIVLVRCYDKDNRNTFVNDRTVSSYF